MTDFNDWFTRQYGERPSTAPLVLLLDEARDLESKAVSGRYLHQRCVAWDERRAAAEAAWETASKETSP